LPSAIRTQTISAKSSTGSRAKRPVRPDGEKPVCTFRSDSCDQIQVGSDIRPLDQTFTENIKSNLGVE